MRLLEVAADAAVAALVSTSFTVPVAAEARVEQVVRFVDPAIDESSGLVDLGDTLLTVNDSGDDAVVYVVDKASGETVGRTTYAEEVIDVEAMALGPDGDVWVGDIGDNRAHRVSVAVYRLPPVTPGDRTVTAERFDLVYSGGPRDAETLLVHPETGRLGVVSKGLFAGEVYEAPRRLWSDRPNRLRRVGRVGGLVTDGAWFDDGRHLVLRDYGDAEVYDSEGWRSLGRIRMPDQPQAEGLAVEPSGTRVLVSSEGAGEPLYSVAVPPALLRAMAPATETATAPAPEGEGAVDPGDDRQLSDDLSYRPDDRVWWLAGATGGVAVVVLLVVVLLRAARRRGRSRR